MVKMTEIPKEIKKNRHTFTVSDEYKINGWCPNGFFEDLVHNGSWEEETFTIIDKFGDTSKTYLDIGAWIGPTVLYAAQEYDRVVCFEPDPIALYQLRKNISINKFQNITLIEKALSGETGSTNLGGSWYPGNSESTLLVNHKFFLDNVNIPGQRGDAHSRTSNIVKVNTITIEDAMSSSKVDPSNIGLIKMDIEGGEYLVIPALKDFLTTHKVPLYISLHFCFLLNKQIEEILDILFSIYAKCTTVEFVDIDKATIIAEKQCSLVFQ